MRLAAERANADAQYLLALMYFEGKGVPLDYAEAYRLLTPVASRLAPGESRDRAARLRDFLAQRMTPEEVGEAHAPTQC